MKTIYPSYFTKFHCSAGACSFTCCREWKIAVDDATAKKWSSCLNPADEKHYLSDYVTYKDEARVIGLEKNGNCPFLQEDKLCKLVCAYGDSVLSATCATFPRQDNIFAHRKEQSLVACCPEVIDIWQNEAAFVLVEALEQEEQNDMLYELRNVLLELLANSNITLEQSLMAGFFSLLDALEQEDAAAGKQIDILGTAPKHVASNSQEQSSINIDRIKKQIPELLAAIQRMEFHPDYTLEECNELFLDIIENYQKEGLYHDLLTPLAQGAKQIVIEQQAGVIDKFRDWLRGYDRLFRNYLSAELFTNLLMEGDSVLDMAIAFEWITMEYVIMRHSIFLTWIRQGQKPLSYEQIRTIMVLIARITGYDRADILDYLERSFESILWDWGYLALLTGN